MSQHRCQDCGYFTDDDAEAEEHQRRTDHCMIEGEIYDLTDDGFARFNTH